MVVHHHRNNSLSLQPNISHCDIDIIFIHRSFRETYVHIYIYVYIVLVYRHCIALWLLYLPSGLTLNNVTLCLERYVYGLLLWAVRTALQKGGFADTETA